MLFFKIIIAAVLAATTSARRVQVDQTVNREVLQRRSVEFTSTIEKRSSKPLQTRGSKSNSVPNLTKPQPQTINPPCDPCDDGPGCC
ncbi:uncharacterized protein MELLADRAFT_124542 [Melampsora larici-populina 98AG31]|uniref:Secreted protein n=1 Tax=Melampsora larici-populina (strain 98AG31 / pathotype 3-4-7) TaxID=747676 RepID=F4RP90_MELLP|nr:uncharacterized protein MELLADRAFT_124542 [Melampsora larici-populina 98AG31]EGG05892.1 secreted protein [Melampsora larici-populina 98AG31]